VALIALLGTLGTALITNWDKIFPRTPGQTAPPVQDQFVKPKQPETSKPVNPKGDSQNAKKKQVEGLVKKDGASTTRAEPEFSNHQHVISGTNYAFIESGGYLVSSGNQAPLCPTPPGFHTGCMALEPEYRQNWRNTPDGYMLNGKKIKTYTNRSERVFEIPGTKQRFYVDDGYLFDYATATILCPWPKQGVGKCQSIDARYQERWRNLPNGFIADGKTYDADEVREKIRQSLF